MGETLVSCTQCSFVTLIVFYCSDGERQSAVVTKTFEVEYAPPPEVAPVDDEMGFQDDLERERSKVTCFCALQLLTPNKLYKKKKTLLVTKSVILLPYLQALSLN